MMGTSSAVRHLSLLGVVQFCVACNSGLRDSGFAVRDSSGVRISVNADSVWDTGDGWLLGTSPDIQVGTSETEPLFEVTTATFLPGNRIAFANSGTSEVIVLDSLGITILRLGRAGDGPGEFRSIDALHRGRGDSLIAFDRTLNRASVFALDGTLGRLITLPRINGARLAQVFPVGDGRFIGSINNRGVVLTSSGALGYARDPATHVVITAVGDIEDTVAIVPGDEQYYVVGGSRPDLLVSMNLFYDKRAVYTVSRAGDLYAGLGNDLSVGIFGLDGRLERIVRDSTANLALTRAEFDQHVAKVVARATSEGAGPPPGWKYDLPIPDTKPPFSAFLLDDTGNLWVAPFREDSFDDPQTWKVFDIEGQLLGSVAMPARFWPLAVSDTRILGRRLTEMDAELIEVYSLVK
jgi:hypothetical protein